MRWISESFPAYEALPTKHQPKLNANGVYVIDTPLGPAGEGKGGEWAGGDRGRWREWAGGGEGKRGTEQGGENERGEEGTRE